MRNLDFVHSHMKTEKRLLSKRKRRLGNRREVRESTWPKHMINLKKNIKESVGLNEKYMNQEKKKSNSEHKKLKEFQNSQWENLKFYSAFGNGVDLWPHTNCNYSGNAMDTLGKARNPECKWTSVLHWSKLAFLVYLR